MKIISQIFSQIFTVMSVYFLFIGETNTAIYSLVAAVWIGRKGE